LRQPVRPQRIREATDARLDRTRVVDGPMALAAAGVVIAGERRDPLQNGGFPGAVVADDDRDRAIELEIESVLKDGQTKRIRCPVADPRRIKPDALEIRCRQLGNALPSHVVSRSLPRTNASRRMSKSSFGFR